MPRYGSAVQSGHARSDVGFLRLAAFAGPGLHAALVGGDRDGVGPFVFVIEGPCVAAH